MYSVHDIQALPWMGCPIRKSPAHSLFSGSPKLNAASHVLHRLSTPSHPPIALSSLTINPLLWETPKDFSFFQIHLSKSNRKRATSPAKFLSGLTRRPPLFPANGSLLNLGGGERIRTDDPLRAKQALFQLSYTPVLMVGLVGLEPTTSRLSGVRSNRD